MKFQLQLFYLTITSLTFLIACGPSPEEKRNADEKRIQDSIAVEERIQDSLDARVNWEDVENTSRTEEIDETSNNDENRNEFDDSENSEHEITKLTICEWCDNEINGTVYYIKELTAGRRKVVDYYSAFSGIKSEKYHQRCAYEKVQKE